MLFKGNVSDFSDACQRAAQDPAELQSIKDMRGQRVKDGLIAMKEERLAVSLYESAIQGANEREAQAQAEYQARQEYVAEAMREAVLNPASDIAAHADKLDRMQKTVDFLRGSVSYGRQIEVTNRLVKGPVLPCCGRSRGRVHQGQHAACRNRGHRGLHARRFPHGTDVRCSAGSVQDSSCGQAGRSRSKETGRDVGPGWCAMNPLKLAEIQALLGQSVGLLKPYQLELLLDALNRRPWNYLNPATQETLTVISNRWRD